MIIVRQSGGLGNQLFQYACGLSLARRSGALLLLDPSYLRGTGKKESLHAFAIPTPDAGANDLRAISPLLSPSGYPGARWKGKILRIFDLFRPASRRRWIIEQSFAYTPIPTCSGRDALITGGWQSERYFRDVADEVRTAITLSKPWCPEAHPWVQAITQAGENAVALHVRRGDYLLPKWKDKYGILPLSYYARGLSFLLTQKETLEVFCFSDDPEALATTIVPDLTTMMGDRASRIRWQIVSNGTIPEEEELMLLSRARHAIIANSTFSWWGAWLRETPGITIAPAHWFASPIPDTTDLVPRSWILL